MRKPVEFCLLVVAAIILVPAVALGAPPPPTAQNVNVINTPNVNVANQPTVHVTGTVPVTGSVALTGTPSVNVANLPYGNWPVQVANTASAPVPVTASTPLPVNITNWPGTTGVPTETGWGVQAHFDTGTCDPGYCALIWGFNRSALAEKVSIRCLGSRPSYAEIEVSPSGLPAWSSQSDIEERKNGQVSETRRIVLLSFSLAPGGQYVIPTSEVGLPIPSGSAITINVTGSTMNVVFCQAQLSGRFTE